MGVRCTHIYMCMYIYVHECSFVYVYILCMCIYMQMHTGLMGDLCYIVEGG